MGMNIGSNKGITYTHRVNNRLNIIDSCSVELIFYSIIEQAAQGMMTAGNLISYRHHHLLTLREELMHLAEILKISLLVYLIICIQSLERNMRHTAGYLPLILVTKDDVAILHHLEQHIMRLQTISPEILTVIDVAGNGQPVRNSKFDGIHS